jgi:WD40 repeat protein
MSPTPRTALLLAAALAAGAGPANRPRLDAQGEPLPAGAVARLGTARWHHPGGDVRGLAFSPDGKSLASCSDHLVVVWDRGSGRPVHRYPFASHDVQAVTFAPGGKVLVLAGNEGGRGSAVCFLEADTGRELRRFAGHPRAVGCAAFSPDGKMVATGRAEVWLWEADTGKAVRRLAGDHPEARVLAFAPDGSLLATAHDAYPDPLRLWDTATGKEVRRLNATARERPGLAFSLDGKSLAFGGKVTIRLFDVATGRELRAFRDERQPLAALAFSPDGRELAAADASGRIAFWDVAAGQEVRRPEAHTGRILAVAFSADGRTVFTTSEDGTARVWDGATGRHQRSWPIYRPHADTYALFASHALTPDGSLLAAVHEDGSVGIWNTADGRKVLSMRTPGEYYASVALSPDGKTLATGCGTGKGGRVSLWDAETCKKRRDLDGVSGLATGLAFSPDGTLLAAAGIGVTTSVWDMATGTMLADVHRPGDFFYMTYVMQFSPDGKYLAVGYGCGTPALRELATGREVEELLHDSRSPRGLTPAVALSPDGKVLAAPVDMHQIGLWDVATGKERARLVGHDGLIYSLAFAPDGRTLVSGGSDNMAYVWEVPAALRTPDPAPPVLSAEELGALWEDLAARDATKGHRALWALAASPRQSVPFLRQRVRPVPRLDERQVRRWLADLDSDSYAVREQASGLLLEQGEAIEPVLRRHLEAAPSVEVRSRVERLLEALDLQRKMRFPSRLRTGRAVQALEYAGGPEARGLLEELARGAPEARLTQEARAALRRLAARAMPGP